MAILFFDSDAGESAYASADIGDESSKGTNDTSAFQKKDLDEGCNVIDDKKASLLMMNFTIEEVEFAMNKLGEYAPVNKLVDFIFAAQLANTDDKRISVEFQKKDMLIVIAEKLWSGIEHFVFDWVVSQVEYPLLANLRGLLLDLVAQLVGALSQMRVVGKGCKLVGCGTVVPILEVSNDDLSNIVDTNDEWISV
ncbi:unnamed protein product [Lactuca virosa]|uniref:Uncharacterized protein n=1 Tax=Lactuca virosa TaxID=75947 RepID=A0AAU9LUR1_9ASTR|nr:unnamed protein product [Lactuca virosa]